jgi:hypothetical protein
MLMIPNQTSEGWTPDAEAVAAMTRYNKELTDAGVLLSLDGFQSTALGARVRFQSGKQPEVADGPFDTAEQTVGGYWLIDVPSKEQAVQWASRCPAGDGDIIEVRQIFEMSDFPPEVRQAAAL